MSIFLPSLPALVGCSIFCEDLYPMEKYVSERKICPFFLQALAKKFAGGSAHKDRPSFLPSEFARLFKVAGERLLQQYVNLQIKKLTLLVRKSVETPNWLKVRLGFDVCCGRDACSLCKCESSGAECGSVDRECHC
jgi:hypothetical protein